MKDLDEILSRVIEEATMYEPGVLYDLDAASKAIAQLNQYVSNRVVEAVKFLTSDFHSVTAERASFKLKPTRTVDSLTNWPIVDEPVIIIPQRVVSEYLATLEATTKEGKV